MKTNIEAQQLIYKKAKEYFYRKKQLQKKIVLNSLAMFLILPTIVLSFTMNILNIDTPKIDNSVGGSSMVTSNTESSTIPQRKIVYADKDYFNEVNLEFYVGSWFYLFDEEFFNKYSGQDVEFFVLIQLGSFNKELKEEFNNKPLKSAELYPDISWNEFYKLWQNFGYHYDQDQYTGEYTYDSFGNKITYGDFVYDLYGNRIYKDEKVQAEIDRMFKFEKNLKEELRTMVREYMLKCLSELNIKFDDELNNKYYNRLFAYITAEDVEKLKSLPFGMMIIIIPENIKDLQICIPE